MHRRGRSLFDCNPQAAACTSPRSNRRLLPISISGRKMSVFGSVRTENAILQEIDAPIERLLADFRWQSIDFVDALWRLIAAPTIGGCSPRFPYDRSSFWKGWVPGAFAAPFPVTNKNGGEAALHYPHRTKRLPLPRGTQAAVSLQVRPPDSWAGMIT